MAKVETMKLDELREKLRSKNVKPSDTWLENQYPARPSERYSKLTYNNYDNIEENFGREARTQLEEYLKKNPDKKVVVLAGLTKKGNIQKKPRIFVDAWIGYDNFASYYGNFELFACAVHMDGFIEVFQNIAERSQDEDKYIPNTDPKLRYKQVGFPF